MRVQRNGPRAGELPPGDGRLKETTGGEFGVYKASIRLLQGI